jgi:hypothetical protein
MPDEAKLNENEDGNAFAGPYVPSPPSRPKLRAEPDARRVATHQKRGPPIGLACCDSVSMARLQHAFALAVRSSRHADIWRCECHVRFQPESSRHSQA